MSTDLRAIKNALTQQLDAIDQAAAEMGCPRELLMDANGGYVAAPIVVALANVELAIDAHRASEASGRAVSR